MALQPFVGLWPLLQFRNFFIHSVGLLGRVISSSQGRYLHTGQHKQRINAHTNIHALSGIRIQDPSFRAGKDRSCLRLRGHCGRRWKEDVGIYLKEIWCTDVSSIYLAQNRNQ
jgi:hypothetical protein